MLSEKPVLASAHMLLEYDFAVQKIAKGKLPKTTEKTHLLVFRNAELEVKFIELNPITFQLLKMISENDMTGEQALISLAKILQHPNPDAIIQFSAEILSDLASQEAIIGSN